MLILIAAELQIRLNGDKDCILIDVQRKDWCSVRWHLFTRVSGQLSYNISCTEPILLYIGNKEESLNLILH